MWVLVKKSNFRFYHQIDHLRSTVDKNFYNSFRLSTPVAGMGSDWLSNEPMCTSPSVQRTQISIKYACILFKIAALYIFNKGFFQNFHKKRSSTLIFRPKHVFMGTIRLRIRFYIRKWAYLKKAAKIFEGLSHFILKKRRRLVKIGLMQSPNMDMLYIFGQISSRQIDWYINLLVKVCF